MNMEICVVTTNLSPSRPLSGSLLSFRVSQKEFYQMLQNVNTRIASIIRVEQIFIKLINYHNITSEEMHLIYIRKFSKRKIAQLYICQFFISQNIQRKSFGIQSFTLNTSLQRALLPQTKILVSFLKPVVDISPLPMANVPLYPTVMQPFKLYQSQNKVSNPCLLPQCPLFLTCQQLMASSCEEIINLEMISLR